VVAFCEKKEKAGSAWIGGLLYATRLGPLFCILVVFLLFLTSPPLAVFLLKVLFDLGAFSKVDVVIK